MRRALGDFAGCAMQSLARMRYDAGAFRYRLRECFGGDAFVTVRTGVLACALSRRALLLTARWLYAPWRECAPLPHARVRNAAACASARRCRMRGCATLSLAPIGALRYRLRARTARRCRLCRWGVRIMMYCISLLRCVALTLRECIRITGRRLSLLRYDAPHLAVIRALDDIFPARDSCGQFQYLRSSVRYCTASEMCSAAISSAPARSAIVRATFRMRV